MIMLAVATESAATTISARTSASPLSSERRSRTPPTNRRPGLPEVRCEAIQAHIGTALIRFSHPQE